MRLFALVLLVTLIASTGQAQAALQRIEPRLAAAIEEHRIFLTCGSLISDDFKKYWTKMVAEARAGLVNQVPLADLAAFDKRTSIEAVMLPSGTPWSRLIDFCAKEHADWFRSYQQLRFVYKIDDTPLPPRQ
jgi:hypothetical protein